MGFEWIQVYDPLGSPWLSTGAAALPIVVLLVGLAVFEWRAHIAALVSVLVALAVSIFVFGMPISSALAAAAYGAAYGLLPIGWIVLAAVFLYNLTVESGQFEVVKHSVGHLSEDRRVQVLLVAFSFGAFIEGAAGFGTPVAICSALLIGLGFPPLHAAGLSLIANTAPVAFGAIGTPILTLGAVTGLDPKTLGMMAGRQLPFGALIVPAWIVVTMSGWRGLRSAWPAVLVCGASFAVVQFAWSNWIGPELVDIAAGITSIAALSLFCRVWQPSDARLPSAPGTRPITSPRAIARAWMPWAFLSAAVMLWGLPPAKALLNGGPAALSEYYAGARPSTHAALAPGWSIPLLDRRVFREYPVEHTPVDRARINDAAYQKSRAEAAVFVFNWASATGTAILLAAVATIFYLRIPRTRVFACARGTLHRMRTSLATISLMLALGFVTRYSGTDATLGLAFTRTGVLYPFFATFLGWLGVALTGSDTSSNVLFGSLQKITAQQLGFNPVLIVTANSTGGVMGKMIDAQSIVVATAATGQSGQEGKILRFVFWHSLALAGIMAAIVMLQAYVFVWMIP
ncbi:MAG: L-lactate permease [Acidobacteriota bacterium]